MVKKILLDAFKIIFTLLTVENVVGKTRLSEHISDFQYVAYSKEDVRDQHTRHKRSEPQDNHEVEIYFNSYGRDFDLRLQKDHSVFHKNYVVEGPVGHSLHHLDHTHYEGYIADEPQSHVFGSLRDGIFDGQITTARDGVFFVERAHRYFPRQNLNSSQHSVIYHEKHIQHPTTKSNLKAPGCGISNEVGDWMWKIQSSGEAHKPTSPPVKSPTTPPQLADPKKPKSTTTRDPAKDPNPLHKYTANANRVKRSIDPPTNRKSCSLFIQTDPLLWRHIRKQEENDAKTQEEILSLIAQHVKAVNRIYGDTEFSAGRYRHLGHTFEVQRIKIHNDSDCTGRPRDERNPFCLPNIDVSNFLNLHSKMNHEHFCLAYVFTYRDFTGGTLGLAWVASASGASGGICEKYKTYTENNQGVHLTSKRSLNTGIITFVNYNTRVPPKVSQLTLAHEIGHNFGSPHDYPDSCHPGGAKGNYIMFASATSGDRDNNNKFSACSVKNISAVLDAIVEDKKSNCFEESNGAFCGNKIVEEGEECDCGFDENECTEQCCYPRVTKDMTDGENKVKRCTLKPINSNDRRSNAPKYKCSPSEGPCCDQNCKFIPGTMHRQCKGDDECTRAAFCNGRDAKCPKPEDKKDNETECNEGTQVCQEGDCKGSICLKFGLEQCFLSSNDPKRRYSTRDLCELACQEKNRNATCRSTAIWADMREGQDRGLNQSLSLRPGSPCDNFQGYCDVFLKCRQVDAEGPLVRLKNLLFNQKTLLSIAQWVTTYWYAVLIMGIGFVIVMALFIKCCASHTPSSNPNMKPRLHVGETLRRPMQTLRRKRYHQAPRNTPPSAGYSVPPQGSSRGPESRGPVPPAQGAPPPYPGQGPRGGPGHGYGDGRGHYNRSQSGASGQGQGSDRRSAGDRRSWTPAAQPGGPQKQGLRGGRMEMNQMSR